MVDYIGIRRVDNKGEMNISFMYENESGEVWVDITYAKCYPVEHGFPAKWAGTLQEWDVRVSVSADLNVEPSTLMYQTAILNAAVKMHEEQKHYEEVLR